MKIDREILRLSLPAVITNITVPLLSLSDTAISGHLSDALPLAAIAVGSVMFNTTFWLFGFLRMGTTGLTAQAFGSGDKDQTATLLIRSLVLAIAIGILLIIIQRPLTSLLIGLMQTEPALTSLCEKYYAICLFSAPALLGTMAINGWFIGMQNTIYPMIVSISVNVINILLSLTLVFVFDMGVPGIACGTSISNWLGFGLAIIFLYRCKKRNGIILSFNLLRHGKGSIKEFFRVNSDIMLRSACIMTLTLGMTAMCSRLGAVAVATNVVMMQFFNIFSYFMDGLAFAAEALSGRFYGAGNTEMLKTSINHIILWGAVCAVLFFAVYLFGFGSFVGLITSVEDVIANALNFKWYIVLIPPLTVFAFLFDGIFIGLTRTRAMLIVTLLAMLTFFALTYFRFHEGLQVIWFAFLAYLVVRGVLLAVYTPFVIRKTELTT